ncbi:MAG TPA: polysaccharide biosynthesis/export family protein [Rhizomicrobium sp.]|jgi:polysaccharide export outer membrane protein
MTLPKSARAVLFGLCLAAPLLGAAQAQDTPALRASYMPEQDHPYHLGTGDKVRVIVYGEDDLSGEFQVDENGDISLPMIGETRASGLTGSQLEQRIQATFADGYLNDPRVSVQVTQYRPFYILGQVNRPGQYQYVNGMTAPNAIALAGGYTDHADDSDIYVRRDGDTHEAELPAGTGTQIYPGDVIRVTKSDFWTVMDAAEPLASALSPFAYSTHF